MKKKARKPHSNWIEVSGSFRDDPFNEAKAFPNVPKWLTLSPDDTLDMFKQSFEAGGQCAFWDAVLFCELTGEPKPEWLHDGLVDYAMERIKAVETKGRKGRPPASAQRNIDIHSVVTLCRMRLSHSGVRQIRGWKDRAYKMAQELLADDGLSLSVGAIRAVSEQVENAEPMSRVPYLYSPFLDPREEKFEKWWTSILAK